MKATWPGASVGRHGRWAIAIAFVALNACGFPFAAFGCLIGAAIVSAIHLHQP